MQITWDLIVLISFGLGIFYGMFFGKNKVLGILVNLMLAYLFVLATKELVYNFVSNFGFVSSRLTTSEFGVAVLLFAIVFGLLIFKSETAGLDSGGTLSTIQAGIYGALVAGFTLVALFSFMSDSQFYSLDSNFANIVYNLKALFIAGPILMMIGTAFLNKK